MSVISTSIDNSNQAITCCVCLDTTPSNTNFRSWNCTGEHSDTICNKCHSQLIEQGDNCPICRSSRVSNLELGQYFNSRNSAINYYNLNISEFLYGRNQFHSSFTRV